MALTKAAALEDGDALRLEDGRLVAIRAAAEDLLEVRAENPARLTRLAWQLGGNHVPAEIAADVLYVPASPANAELVRGRAAPRARSRAPSGRSAPRTTTAPAGTTIATTITAMITGTRTITGTITAITGTTMPKPMTTPRRTITPKAHESCA